MGMHRIRRALRGIGLHLPFPSVICPELRKTVHIEPDWRARVVTRRTLVFTKPPRRGDLCDRFAIDPAAPLETLFYDSPDAIEVGRRRPNKHTLAIDWLPREPVSRYTLYYHEDTWMAPETHRRPAIASEFRCDMKTGAVTIEFVTPGFFEAGIGFPLSRWRTPRTERRLMKRALGYLQANTPAAARPRFEEGGRRALWQIETPRIGERYAFVLFHENGVVEWERRIQESSLAGRARKLLGGFAHAFRT